MRRLLEVRGMQGCNNEVSEGKGHVMRRLLGVRGK